MNLSEHYYAVAQTSAALPDHDPSTQARILGMLADQCLSDLLEVVPVPYDVSTVEWSFVKAIGWWAEPEPPEWPERVWIEGPYVLTATVTA